MNQPRPGHTLPVFACAAAKAALQHLQEQNSPGTVTLNLITPAETAEIPIEQVASLSPHSALAITRSDPGDNLDLTRHTPIWAKVERTPNSNAPSLKIQGGEGIGYHEHNHHPAIYGYAHQLFQENLHPLLSPTDAITITIILPHGKRLASRTSNAAFGIVEGLALLGTTGTSQPLSAPGQLELYQTELKTKAQQFDTLVFCIGENGLDLAQKLGIPSIQLIKTANWLGPMLVAAALAGVQSILLLGYHGKLIKLAGGIFHTHHHLADGRQEILTAHAASLGLPTPHLQTLLQAPTTEDALNFLRHLQTPCHTNWVGRIYTALAQQIDQRSQTYIYQHSEKHITVGSLLFDRKRQIIIKSQKGEMLFTQIC